MKKATQETKAGGSLWVRVQPGLHYDFQAVLLFRETPSKRNKNKNETGNTYGIHLAKR